MDRSILLTGSSGAIGVVVRRGIAGRYRLVRLFDRVQGDPPGPAEEWVEGDITDGAAVEAATEGIDTVVHLAAIPFEAPFDEILPNNIVGTHRVFEAARRRGARRVVFASTNHVVGFYPVERRIDPAVAPRPDTFYGVSKVFGEALGRLYHDKWGLEVVCLRIGSFRRTPADVRSLATWLSHDDAVRLFAASIDAEDVGFEIVYGISNNTRAMWESDAGWARLGYEPVDDAEDFAAELRAGVEGTGREQFHGGPYTRPDHMGGM